MPGRTSRGAIQIRDPRASRKAASSLASSRLSELWLTKTWPELALMDSPSLLAPTYPVIRTSRNPSFQQGRSLVPIAAWNDRAAGLHAQTKREGVRRESAALRRPERLLGPSARSAPLRLCVNRSSCSFSPLSRGRLPPPCAQDLGDGHQ